jgi:hypothetical protein
VDGLQTAGDYQVFWNALDDAGDHVSGGVYLAQLAISSPHIQGRDMMKMLLLK